MATFLDEIVPDGTGFQNEYVVRQDGRILELNGGTTGGVQVYFSTLRAADGTLLDSRTIDATSSVIGFAAEPEDLVTLTDGRIVGSFLIGQRPHYRIFDADGTPLTDYVSIYAPTELTPVLLFDLKATPSGGFSVLLGDDGRFASAKDVTHIQYDAAGNVISSITLDSSQNPNDLPIGDPPDWEARWGFRHEETATHAVLPDGSFAISYAAQISATSPVIDGLFVGNGVRTTFLAPDGTVTGFENTYIPTYAPFTGDWINNVTMLANQTPRTVALGDGTIVTFYHRNGSWHVQYGTGAATAIPDIPGDTRALIAQALPNGQIAVLTEVPSTHAAILLLIDGGAVVQSFRFDGFGLPQGRFATDGLDVAPDGTLLVSLNDRSVHRFVITDNLLFLPDDAAVAVQGGAGGDTYVGDGAAREILLRQGDDAAFGGNGDETIRAGEGDDTAEGGGGRDVIYGQAGDDSLLGGGWDDALYGQAGNDILIGGVGYDTLGGGEGHDTAYGGAGDDAIYGGASWDSLFGGDGNDTLGGGPGEDILDGGGGNDELWASVGDDTAQGGAGDDTLGGFTGDDVLSGDDGADEIWGADGTDTLSGGDGNDQLGGGTGNDSADGGAGDDTVSGGLGDDTLFGGTGDDLIFGAAGADEITGGAGNDTVWAGPGVDVVIFGAGDGADLVNVALADTLRLDDALWGGGLSGSQVLAQFGSVSGADYLLDFGGGDSMLLAGLGSASQAQLAGMIDIV